MRRISQSLILFAFPGALVAQAIGPTAGAWGAEARSDVGGALLRFRNEAAANVIGFRGSYDHNSLLSGDQVSIDTRIGRRRYSRLSDKTRPFRTISVLANYSRFSTLTMAEVGLGLEMGAAHFFTPHVSIGASGELTAGISRRKTTSPFSGSSTTNGYGFGFSGFRVFGGVYF